MTNAVSSLKLEQRGACLDKVSVKYQTSALYGRLIASFVKKTEKYGTVQERKLPPHHFTQGIYSPDPTTCSSSIDIEIFWLRFIIYMYIMICNFRIK